MMNIDQRFPLLLKHQAEKKEKEKVESIASAFVMTCYSSYWSNKEHIKKLFFFSEDGMYAK